MCTWEYLNNLSLYAHNLGVVGGKTTAGSTLKVKGMHKTRVALNCCQGCWGASISPGLVAAHHHQAYN